VPDETVVVATFTYRHEGEFALETLRAAGIRAVLLADDAGGAYPGLSLSSRPPRILVHSDDAERARALLGEAAESPGLED
jgi:hypothetical protein